MKDVFVARQPIFNVKQHVLGYELLFRSSLENFFTPGTDLDAAASQTIANSFLVFGMDTLTNHKKAFINFTDKLLFDEVPFLLPPDSIVVEILENVIPDKRLVDICRKLKKAGFVLALDDFVFHEGLRPLMDLADIIKVDFLQTRGDEREKIMHKVANHKVRFLAEKVETKEDFKAAAGMGYTYFQGYFFSKPLVIKGRDIPGYKLNMLQLISELNRPDAQFENLENIIKHDLALSYKLLRLMNSAFFSFSSKIESIRHALVLLGIKEIRKWASLLALSGLADDKPQELMDISVIRARFCEALSEQVGLQNRQADCFLMGMFSLIDALVDKPLEEVLKSLPLADDVNSALMGNQNLLNDLLKITVGYERGSWKDIAGVINRLGIVETVLPEIYYNSVEWANKSW